MRPIAFLTALIAALLLPSSLASAHGDWDWPVRGRVVTQFRNGDDPYAAGQHRGIDVAAPTGTPVVAATAGTVAYAGTVGSAGVVVAERSADGRYELSYLHLSSIAVRRGQVVDAGDTLGAVGVTGTRSIEQPHLHFGVREAADRHGYLDPLTFLAPPPAEPAPRAVPVAAREPATVRPLPAVAAGVAAAGPAPAARPLPVHAPAGQFATPHAAHASRAHAGGSPARAPLHTVMPAAGSAHSSGPGRLPIHPRRATGSAAHPAAPAHGPAAARRPVRAPAGHGIARHTGVAGGLDGGWLAACVGLVAAAALLAGPAGGRRGRPSGRAVFAQLMRAASRG